MSLIFSIKINLPISGLYSSTEEPTESISQEPTPEPKQFSEQEQLDSPIEKEPPSYKYDNYDTQAAWDPYEATAAWNDTNEEEIVPSEQVPTSEEYSHQPIDQTMEYSDQEYQPTVDG